MKKKKHHLVHGNLENPCHPKIDKLVEILKKEQVLFDGNNIPKGEPAKRNKMVIYFESIDSLKTVNERLKQLLKKEKKILLSKLPKHIVTKLCTNVINIISGKTPGHEGNTGKRTRSAIAKDFREQDSPYILLCSRVGFEGIDLHEKCDRLVHYDLHWNPTVMEQRVGRVYRGEKMNPLEIKNYHIIVPNTYDNLIQEVMKKRAKYKDFLLGEKVLKDMLGLVE